FTRARIVTIYNGFDLDEIRRRASLPEPGLPREPYIVHAGRFARQKRHDLLLDAYALAGLPHRLVLLTKPSEELERMIAARGLSGRVTVAGFHETPFPWYANAALLVLSSDHEGFPNVLVEALACGTSVVSTDCPSGPREILQGELSRFLSPCGDVEALARNMVVATRDHFSFGVAIAEKFSEKTTLELFECLASYSQGAAATSVGEAE